MSSARPKRKAASNKNYSDAAHESLFGAPAPIDPPQPAKSTPNGNKSSKRKPPSSPSKSPSVSSPGGFRVPYNWQPPPSVHERFSCKLDLTEAVVNVKLQTLTCPHQPVSEAPVGVDDSKELQNLIQKHTGSRPEPFAPRRKQKAVFQLKKGDYIYMVSEPPGEPYYIGRVMGFTRKNEVKSESESEDAANYVFQIQWFYRPRDISKHTSDSRLLFASMHSDTCPLASFRGLVTVYHKSDVEQYFQPPPNDPVFSSALEYYASFPNCFYFEKLFDRYMIKFYDIIKTSTLLQYVENSTNNSRNYILALSKRFEFIFMEAPRVKSFINNFASTSSTHCDICAEWCGANESVICAGCDKHFHMLCLDPPLLKKPSRGFSWSCAVCTKKHEMEHQRKKIVMLSHDNRSTNEEELLSLSDSLNSSDEPPVEKKSTENILPKYELMAIDYLEKDASTSVVERRLKEEWSLRYLGLHVRLEDAVDPDDRSPYPRASTSLGARFQASNIPEYEDHPIVYYDPDKSSTGNKKKPSSSKKTPKKKSTETSFIKELPVPKEYADVPPREYPQWLQPRPKGYIERGLDEGEAATSTLMWKPLEADKEDDFAKLDRFTAACAPIAEKLGLHPNSPNFVDAVLKAYLDCQGDTGKATEIVAKLTRKSLHEPTLNKEELKRFEAGVRKHGSELYPIFKEVKTQPSAMVVRFYYLWKKTKRGRAIWGNYPGRKKKSSKEAEMKIKPLVDDYADSDDDSAYENEKICAKKRLFRCKHCKSYESYKWFKITGFDGTTQYDNLAEIEDVDPDTVTALCFRCARLWRRYAVYWEDPLEVERKNARGIGGYKRKVESELVVDSNRTLDFAEKHGVTLSYELTKPYVESSVISAQKDPLVNGNSKAPPKKPSFPTIQAEKPTRIPVKKSENGQKAAPKPKKETTPGVSEAPRMTSRQLSLSSKPTEPEPEEVPVVKKRKVEPAVKKEAPAREAPKKRSVPASSTSSSTKKKKIPLQAPPIEGSTKTPEPEVAEVVAPKVEARTGTSRRQKKNSDNTIISNPIFNPMYRGKIPEVASLAKIDKKLFPQVTTDVLQQLFDNFKIRQLLDMKSLTNGWQVPHQAKIDLPFAAGDRKCCICMELDGAEASAQESLICSNCGVNVHSSCAGVTIIGKNRPVKQWLCDACINDMGAKFSPSHTCCMSPPSEIKPELAILGCSSQRPPFLIPILESGKWCQLLCALFCYKQLSLRVVSPPSFISREILHATQCKSTGLVVESASRMFVENYSKSCVICKENNGALMQCEGEDDSYIHVTCAQIQEDFKLGFELVPQADVKSATTTFVEGQCGKLEPIVARAQHSQKIFSLRESGKRSVSGDPKPLIQLFIEDLSRMGTKLSGPQLIAHNYATMVSNYVASTRQKVQGEHSGAKENGVLNGSHFSNGVAGKGHESNGHDASNADAVKEEEDDGTSFYNELLEPLCGEEYGIKDPNDHVSKVQVNGTRSEIKLGDILG